MKKSAKSILVASMLALATATSAYAVEKAHEKSSVSQYVDDASITANIKAKHAEDKSVHHRHRCGNQEWRGAVVRLHPVGNREDAR